MEDLKIKNNVSVLIFVILICLLFVHSRKMQSRKFPVFILTSGILIYTFYQLYIYFSNNKIVTLNMFLSQIVFNSIILVVIIMFTLSNTAPYKDDFELPSSTTEPGMGESACTESRQIFEVSPIKKCCGGSYMRTSKPGMDKFCSQFSEAEIINSCVARKHVYAVPEGNRVSGSEGDRISGAEGDRISGAEGDQEDTDSTDDKKCLNCPRKRTNIYSIMGVS